MKGVFKFEPLILHAYVIPLKVYMFVKFKVMDFCVSYFKLEVSAILSILIRHYDLALERLRVWDPPLTSTGTILTQSCYSCDQ